MNEINRLNRMYRMRELPRFVGMHRTQIGELIKVGKFPRPVTVGTGRRAIAWLEEDLISWQLQRVAERNGGAES